ncbi:MAG: RAMP superfamily CRISPR-associated protein [Pyrinomonadaceae bacterium]
MSNNSPEKFTVRLEMKSDWHIGTGSGIPGSVDALLARDGEGFPCIPAKTVVGIWRDAMETLTLGLDGGDEANKNWQNWVNVVFGSQPNVDKNPNDTPRPSILSIKPARIDENLRNAIKNSSEIDQTKYKQALTFIKPNTQIESVSGTAQTDSLRFTEMGRIGSILDAEFTLDCEDFDENQKELVKALLAASAGFVERIGGNRRRGSGRCEMKVDCGATDAIAVLEKYQKNLSSIPEVEAKEELEPVQKASSDEWKRIEFLLTLQTPVAIVTNTLGNVSETLDFIPGTYLLPHITKKLKDISKYVTSGDFQVLPATIEVGGTRGMPVPKVIWYHKVDGGFEIPNTVYNKIKEPKEVEDLTRQKKNYREGYVSSLHEDGKTLPFYDTTKKTLFMHNTVEDEFQRPTENVGGVFSRQAIKAGTVLKGEIRFKASIENDVKGLENYTNDVRLGTSKKDDYGFADLKFKTIGEIPANTDETQKSIEKDKLLVVYLASDVLLRNENLRQTNLVADLKAKLEQELSVSLTETESLIQVRRIESWHEGWGFPRPTFTAMQAGSVAVFEVVGAIDNNELRKLELSGIGERRGEGYGQIRFNPKILTEKINDWTVSSKIEKPKIDENERNKAVEKLKNQSAGKFKKFIENIEISAWREEIARAVLKIANDDKKRLEIFGFGFKGKESVPPLSQIGGLRSTVGKVKLDGSNKTVVTDWLTHLQGTSNRKDKWKHNFGVIEELFTDDKEVGNG